MKWIVEGLESVVIGIANAMRGKRKVVGSESDAGTDCIGLLESGRSFNFLPSDLERSIHIVGTTGSGKTCIVLRIIELDILQERTLVILDLRGDLVAAVLAICTKLGIDPSRVTLIDLRDRASYTSVGFDPMAGPGLDYVKALHVLSVLADSASSWGVSVEEYCRNALLVLSMSKRNLLSMESLFYDENFLSDCLNYVSDESLLAFWGRYRLLGADKQRLIASSVLNKLSSLLSAEPLKELLGNENPIDLGRLLSTDGNIILISFCVDELHRSAIMLSNLVIAAVEREVFSKVNVPPERRTKVRLVVDEFEHMADDSLCDLIQESRRFSTNLLFSHQQYSQLPGKLKSLILSNSGLRLFFQLGHEDARAVSHELPQHFGIPELRNQKPGEAILMRRDGSAFRVRFNPPRPMPLASDVARFRQQVLCKVPSVSKIVPTRIPARVIEKPDLKEWI